MQDKIKMILQRDKKSVHIQQQSSVSFSKQKIPNLDFLADMAIIMILLMTKYLENFLRSSSLNPIAKKI